MKVLVIGGGGREHAIVHTLKKSPKVDYIWCAPGNGGIAAEAECVAIKATDIDGMVAFAKENKPDLVMVAPDDPLALGMVDALEAAAIRAFGPRKNAAIIEGSKSFAKDLMQKYNIPTAGYAVFENSADAIEYIRKNGAPIVVKADGLALGKGVTVAMTEEDAIEAVKDAIDGGAFGGAGARVVIEEFLTGPEVSVLAFVDGKHLKTTMTKARTRAAWALSRRLVSTPTTSRRSVWRPSSSRPLLRWKKRAVRLRVCCTSV